MSQRLKRYLDDVMDGNNTAILEISQDLSLQNRFKSLVKDLNITEQTLECCLKEIATVLLEDSVNYGCLVSLLLFSREFDSYHSTHSVWYRRYMLIETLHDIFLEYSNRLYKKQCYYFCKYSLLLLVFSLILILFWLKKKIEREESGIVSSDFIWKGSQNSAVAHLLLLVCLENPIKI